MTDGCHNCRYLSTTDHPNGIIGQKLAVCRRNPPVPIAVPHKTGVELLTIWPAVNPIADRCGQHATTQSIVVEMPS